MCVDVLFFIFSAASREIKNRGENRIGDFEIEYEGDR
jgi:hypothetical protein